MDPLSYLIQTGIKSQDHGVTIHTLLSITNLVSKQRYWLSPVLFPGAGEVWSLVLLLLKVKLTPTSRLLAINVSLHRSPIVMERD